MEGQVEEGDWQALLQVETPGNPNCGFNKYCLVRDYEPHASPGWKQEPLSQHSTQPQSEWRLQQLAQG